MGQKPNFRLVSSFDSLAGESKEFVVRETEQIKQLTPDSVRDFSKKRLFLGINREEKLVGFVAYSFLRDGSCSIKRLWGSLSKDFVRSFGVTPASYLAEELVRRGAKVFVVSGQTSQGRLFFSRKRSAGLIRRKAVQQLALGFRVTPLWSKKIKGRVLLRG